MLYSICWFDIINLNIVSFFCLVVFWVFVYILLSIGGYGNILKNIKNIFKI